MQKKDRREKSEEAGQDPCNLLQDTRAPRTGRSDGPSDTSVWTPTSVGSALLAGNQKLTIYAHKRHCDACGVCSNSAIFCTGNDESGDKARDQPPTSLSNEAPNTVNDLRTIGRCIYLEKRKPRT